MKIFELPDLGEGLPDAEIVEWRVSEGDHVTLDGPLVSMETAKAVVDVPSPFTGKVVKLFGQAGDVIETGSPLAGFELESEDAESVDDELESTPPPDAVAETEPTREDSGTVVGRMESSDTLLRQSISSVAGVKVTPAVRALARKLGVDLATVTPSGPDGVVTRGDVETAVSKPRAAAAFATPPAGEWQAIRGTRRTMARTMAESQQQVVPTTVMDDADIDQWRHDQDITARLIRALWAGANAEPGLNAWFDGVQNTRMIHKGMDVGMAMDTPDGLFVVALRDVHEDSATSLRTRIDHLGEMVKNRSIPPEDLRDYTIVLSNFGMFAGRYATPVITPPCVAIIAAGKLRQEVVPVLGGLEVHKIIPLSLTFDHRAATGGEAARFLKAMLEDLALPD